MKTRNRLLAMFLTLVMTVGMLPISAFAENDAPATDTDIAIENMDGNEEDTAREGASPSDPGELPGAGEDKEQGDNSGGEDKTAESTPTPEPSKAPDKQAAPAQEADDETPSAVSFTVSFNANGHGQAPEAVSVRESETVPEPAAMEAEGYSFLGWFRDQEANVVWDFDNDTVNHDMTLYAGWKENISLPLKSGMLRNGAAKSVGESTSIPGLKEIRITANNPHENGWWRKGDTGKAEAVWEEGATQVPIKWSVEVFLGNVEIAINSDTGAFEITRQDNSYGRTAYIVATADDGTGKQNKAEIVVAKADPRHGKG